MYPRALFFHQKNVENLGLREKTRAGNRRALDCRITQRRVINFSLEFRILRFKIHENEGATWILISACQIPDSLKTKSLKTLNLISSTRNHLFGRSNPQGIVNSSGDDPYLFTHRKSLLDRESEFIRLRRRQRLPTATPCEC
jgi:hypothetical protein